ncbi:uncharacterized protein L201_001722 [Kwoniella dendrophila CBS 6074]|uniref:Uncharacterized protein n=1 Tax=Kwoniella dendrophila CBS 6074 TaxID=1295534 RepID=A0AAX4JPP2_9TREE
MPQSTRQQSSTTTLGGTSSANNQPQDQNTDTRGRRGSSLNNNTLIDTLGGYSPERSPPPPFYREHVGTSEGETEQSEHFVPPSYGRTVNTPEGTVQANQDELVVGPGGLNRSRPSFIEHPQHDGTRLREKLERLPEGYSTYNDSRRMDHEQLRQMNLYPHASRGRGQSNPGEGAYSVYQDPTRMSNDAYAERRAAAAQGRRRRRMNRDELSAENVAESNSE